MRILHITTAFPRNNKDVITPWLIKLIDLQSREHTVEVFTPSYKGHKSHFYKNIMVWRYRYAPFSWERLTHEGTVINQLRKNKLRYLLLLPFFMCGMIALYKLYKDQDYDIIHIHWHVPLAILTIPVFHKNVKIITTLYGSEVALARKNKLFGIMARILKKYIYFYIPISSFTAKLFEKVIGKYEYKVIPYGSSFESKEIETKPFNGRFLFVGRLVKRKGVDILIEAISKIKNKEWELHIVGTGIEEEKLKDIVKNKKLENKIIFEGKVSNKRLEELYEWADILVLPSYDDGKGDIEGLGVVILEMFSYKKPAIGTNWGGVTDIIKDGYNGFLAEHSSVESMKKTIERVYENKDKLQSMGINAKETLKNFDWNKVINDIDNIYM